MALTSTIHQFDIALADVDRGVYEAVALRVARHPSESMEYMLTRVLAYCLEWKEGIAFSNGLAEPDMPAVMVRDLTGTITRWIEIGAPDADRLHRASKATNGQVAVYTHREPRIVLQAYEGARIHKSEAIPLYAIDRPLLEELGALVDRRTAMDLSVTERELYIGVNGRTLTGVVSEHRLQG